MQHRISRDQIIQQTLIVYSDLYRMMAEGKYLEVKQYIRDAHGALVAVTEMDKEDAQCLEALKKKLASEGTILPISRGGRGSLARRPQPPTTPIPS
jgi:hypothetical protein